MNLGCDKLKSINIPYGITSIEEQLFCECRSLSDISLPETVTSIHQAAFASCTSLTSVRLAGELTTAGSYIFDDCPALSSFEGPNASADGRCLIIKDTLVAFAPKGIKDYRIPEEVVYFSFKPIVSDEIETISMSDNVLGVQGDVYMFIQLPKLREITLSARIADVGINFCCDCPSLTKVYLRAPLPPAVGYRSENDDTGLSVYVPRESLELYKSSGNWTFWKEQFKAYDYSDLPSDINTDFYCSTDYSRDGQVSTFQTATEGNGIDLVFMGDAFSDRQIADGTYRDAMQKGIEAFFSIEPYKSFRHLFNVQIVDVVSRNEGYNYYAPALGTHFSDNTYIELDDTCIDYICKAVPEEHLNEVTTVILMNSDRYAGTCYEFIPDEQSDYGQGFSIALLPIMSYNYENLMHHEAGGHGFAKLLDEYAYEENGKAPDSIIDELRSFSQIGWGKNLDITDDPEKVKWAHFLTDSRYKSEGLGVFEGGRTYNKGVWRSTEESMMNHNIGNFNAPSREAIYYRIHKLAYGKDWKYNYEDFVCYDAVSRAGFSAETSNKKMTHSAETSVRNTAHTPPVIMDKNWRVIKNKK